MSEKNQDFKIWKRSMTCICGAELSLDILGKNFKQHITEDARHLKYLRKLWRKKQKQGKPPLFFNTPVEYVEQNKNT
tara:strand:- start:483 stop:713 length:231 start_codon:yes stop_codon:yes gene_type:complete